MLRCYRRYGNHRRYCCYGLPVLVGRKAERFCAEGFGMKHSSKVYSGLVYLAPSGDWAWRIFCDSEDVVRGAGYAGAQEAEADCREFLNDYDGQAEIVVEKPAFGLGP